MSYSDASWLRSPNEWQLPQHLSLLWFLKNFYLAQSPENLFHTSVPWSQLIVPVWKCDHRKPNTFSLPSGYLGLRHEDRIRSWMGSSLSLNISGRGNTEAEETGDADVRDVQGESQMADNYTRSLVVVSERFLLFLYTSFPFICHSLFTSLTHKPNYPWPTTLLRRQPPCLWSPHAPCTGGLLNALNWNSSFTDFFFSYQPVSKLKSRSLILSLYHFLIQH